MAARPLERERLLAPLLVLPVAAYVALLVGFPFLMAFVYSVSDATVGNPRLRIVGLQNFAQLISDPVFRTSLRNTLVFTFVSIALLLVLSNFLAEVLTRPFPARWLIRFLILLPWTTPIALGTIGYLWFLDSVFSPLDWLLRRWGLLGSPGALLGPASNMYWLGRRELAMTSVILVHVWRLLPLATLIRLAGLSGIHREIIEAAHIDGARYWRRLFHVVLPLLLPALGVTVLFSALYTFTDMTVVWVLTKGGPPPHGTQVLASLAFLTGIQGGDLARGAAIALFLFPVLAGIASLVLRIAKKAVVT